jgi:hypothetical protein
MSEVPPIIQIRRERWLKQAKRFSAIHYSLGLISVFASTSASFTGLLDNNPIKAASLAGIGAISGGLVAFLNPLKESEKRWRAWKLLDAKCLELELDSSNPKIKELIDAVRTGEGLLGEGINRNDEDDTEESGSPNKP